MFAAPVRFSNFAGLPFCPAASSYQWTSGQLSSSSLEIIKKEQKGFSLSKWYIVALKGWLIEKGDHNQTFAIPSDL